MQIRRLIVPGIAGLAAFVAASPPAVAATGEPTVRLAAQLPDLGLGDFQNDLLPGTVDDDHGVQLGGLGSGLFPIGPTPDGEEFWIVTDRGPNGEAEVGDETRRTFVVEAFDPTLVRLAVVGGSLEVRESIPITTPEGEPVSGLSNLAERDEVPYAADAATLLPTNPDGLDTEGVVRTADGHFWLVDEYGPSIVELDASGHVLMRHLPAGLEDDYTAAGVGYPVAGTLPAALADRRANRGFEDIAILPDGVTVVVALQSALVVEGDRDRIVTELLTFDTAHGATVGEFAYRFDEPSTFTATDGIRGGTSRFPHWCRWDRIGCSCRSGPMTKAATTRPASTPRTR